MQMKIYQIQNSPILVKKIIFNSRLSFTDRIYQIQNSPILVKKKKKSFLIVDYRLQIGLIFFRQVQLGHAVLSTIGT